VAGANRRRLARLEAARGGGSQADRLRAEVEHRLHLAAPEPVPERPAVDVTGMTDDEFEAYLNSLIVPNPRRDRLHARFREAADGSDAERYLSLFQTGGACATPR